MARFEKLGAWCIAVGSVASSACGGDEALSGRPSSGGVITVDAGGALDNGLNLSGSGAGSGAETGLPCDVQQLLENRCIGCHLAASPPALLTYDDLMKPAPSDGTKNLARVSLERMQNAAKPMPPAPAVAPSAAEIATLDAWIKAGTPKGVSCTPPAGAGPTTGGNPYATPLVCTSAKTGSTRHSTSMDPGRACITCHTIQGGPAFAFAGTVYPTAHEPNDCVGSNAALSVVVTDAAGAVTTVRVNAVGNFQFEGRIAAPFHVKVTNGVAERVMNAAVTAGDCNACHTPTGANGAPGRIMAP